MNTDLSKKTAQRLLDWYDLRQRDLPWRIDRDPYRIWISEIMLQQTQVQTVIPYYEAFLERFPTVEDLAAAPLEDVLARWSGLGYYRRARFLHAAAIEVVERGGFPTSSEGLRSLPGIGAYTAAAVASQAYGEVVPVLDGNVERLLSRRLAFDGDPKKSAGRQLLGTAAADLLVPERPGDSNQAMMELGAMVCRPRNPRCDACPISHGCRALDEGDVERYPRPRQRRKTEKYELAAAVATDGDRLILFRRPASSEVMPGLWEVATVPYTDDRPTLERTLGERYGSTWRLGTEHGVVRHSITHRSLTVHVFDAEISRDYSVHGSVVSEGPEAAWVEPERRHRYPASSLLEKILGQLG